MYKYYFYNILGQIDPKSSFDNTMIINQIKKIPLQTTSITLFDNIKIDNH